MRKFKRKSAIKKLDNLFSLVIRKRDKRCQRCGKTENLQCAHIMSRKNVSTRWNMLNAVTLCYACHFFWAHRNPIDFAEFIRERLGEKYDNLILMAHTPKKFTDIELQKMIKEYGVGK